MQLPDVFVDAQQQEQWSIIDGAKLEKDLTLEADVIIVGSGAGGGVAAEALSRGGKKVILIEEGGLFTSRDFRLQEVESYTKFYQDGMARATKDGAISILQGRTVGGSTTVNWTSSFRTPEPTLQHWAEAWQVLGLDSNTLEPWFEAMEQRLHIQAWQAINANNDMIRRGSLALGWKHGVIPRNVRGCWNLGACGLGCPTNAKQSTLVSFIPDALRQGTTLLHRVRAQRFVLDGDRVRHLEAEALDAEGKLPIRVRVFLRAPLFVAAGGAIGSPGLLLRSQVPNPYGILGRRTFFHPTLFAFAQTEELIHPYHGAPQSIYSDHFQWQGGVTGPIGYKIEASPLPPGFASVLMRGHGRQHFERMQALSHTSASLALLRDGFHEDSSGGRVELRSDQTAVVDYPLNDYLFDGARRAFLSMAEMYFAAGAKAVHLAHGESGLYRSWVEARQAIEGFRYEKLRLRIGSAHAMGGCAMSEDPKRGVVNSRGRHHQVENLYVWDGSIFPTSIGTNPQLSIFAIVSKLAQDFLRSEGS